MQHATRQTLNQMGKKTPPGATSDSSEQELGLCIEQSGGHCGNTHSVLFDYAEELSLSVD